MRACMREFLFNAAQDGSHAFSCAYETICCFSVSDVIVEEMITHLEPPSCRIFHLFVESAYVRLMCINSFGCLTENDFVLCSRDETYGPLLVLSAPVSMVIMHNCNCRYTYSENFLLALVVKIFHIAHLLCFAV